MRRLSLVVVAIALVLAGCSAVSLPSTPAGELDTPSPTVTGDPGVPADGQTWRATVTRVVDGDTVAVRYPNGSSDTVRLVGVDTPETRGATNPAEFEGVPENESGRTCLADAGDRATRALATWVNGTEVRLVHDPATDVRDRYDRLLAYVVREDANLNYRLVARGHARVYDTEFTLANRFYATESVAQREARGVWGCADPTARSATDGLRVRVVADAPGNDNENRNGEFVVFENVEDDPRSVGNWTVADEAGRTYAFPANATIPATGSVRLYSGSGTSNATAYFWGADGAVWNNDGDTVTVRDANGTVVVQRSY